MDAVAEAVYDVIVEGERVKGGWVTLCENAWVDRHSVTAHAATCAECRKIAEEDAQ